MTPQPHVAYISVNMDIIHRKMMLRREVETIRARNHDNIVRFYASFTAERESDKWTRNNPKECLYLLYEYANGGNLKEWLAMEETPDNLRDPKTRGIDIMRHIKGLVGAVTYIHEEIEDRSAYHGDINPGSIVIFGGEKAIWKISDFGMATSKHFDDEGGATYGSGGKHEYWPPEYAKERVHGRPSDVFSLGCVLLELATIWEYGWDGAKLKEFRDLRRNNEQCSRAVERLKYDQSYHNNLNVVGEWLRKLRQSDIISKDAETEIHTRGNQREAEDDRAYRNYFRTLLDLIEGMLKEKAQRLFIWEINMDLHEIAGNKTLEELRHHFGKIVQPPRKATMSLDNTHNPLRRALDRGKIWQVLSLRAIGWSIEVPQADETLPPSLTDSSDLQSVRSIEAPLSLLTGTTLASIFQTAAEQFADILLEDGSLRLSFEAVIQQAGREKLKRNLSRLLRKYALALKIEASSAVETNAARMVNRQANRIVNLVMGRLQNAIPFELSQVTALKEERELVLERFLQGQVHQGEISQPEVPSTVGEYEETFPISSSESNSGEDDVVNEPEKLDSFNLKGVERFMIESIAYEQLIKDFLSFATPVEKGNDQPTEDHEPTIVTLQRLHWTCVGHLFHFVVYVFWLTSLARFVATDILMTLRKRCLGPLLSLLIACKILVSTPMSKFTRLNRCLWDSISFISHFVIRLST